MVKKFKPHKMYSKSGITEFVTTMKKHLSLKEKGYTHNPKK
jgi:hypothetical protein